MEYAIHALLYRAAHRQRNAMRPYLRRLGLGPGQPRLLVSLERDGPSSQKRLADSLEVDPSAVCRMLDTLEVKQLAEYLERLRANLEPQE